MNSYNHHEGYCIGSYDYNCSFAIDQSGIIHAMRKNGALLSTVCKRNNWDGLGPMSSTASDATCRECISSQLNTRPMIKWNAATAQELKDYDYKITDYEGIFTITDYEGLMITDVVPTPIPTIKSINSSNKWTYDEYQQRPSVSPDILQLERQLRVAESKHFNEMAEARLTVHHQLLNIDRLEVELTNLKNYIRNHGLLVPGEPAKAEDEVYPLNIEVK